MPTFNIPDQHFDAMSSESETTGRMPDHGRPPRVTIDASMYKILTKTSEEYAALKNALLSAGVTQEHLDTLVRSQISSDDSTCTSISGLSPRSNASTAQTPVKHHYSANAEVFVPRDSTSLFKSSSFDTVRPICSISPKHPSFCCDDPDAHPDWYDVISEPEQHKDHISDRSVVIRGFSPFTTLADIAKIVRGGIVLNMFIRPKYRAAHVSFVDPIAAEKFVMHYKRNDLYVKGKRLDISWDERQSYIPGYVQRQVYNNNATRNLVIRFAKYDMTPESVREDLEHIDRLEIVDIIRTENHIFVSLNAIQHAITARHCMLSRLKYKGTKIEFFEDECDQLLPPVVKKVYHSGFQPQKRPATVAMANRFALLFEDDGEMEDMGKPMKRIVSSPEKVKKPAWMSAFDAPIA